MTELIIAVIGLLIIDIGFYYAIRREDCSRKEAIGWVIFVDIACVIGAVINVWLIRVIAR